MYITTIAKHASTSLNKKNVNSLIYIGWENYISHVTLIHGNLNKRLNIKINDDPRSFTLYLYTHTCFIGFKFCLFLKNEPLIDF